MHLANIQYTSIDIYVSIYFEKKLPLIDIFFIHK